MSASHQIDHIIAEKHGGPTDPDNLALCCTLCNRYKGSDLTAIDPETGQIVPLFHPRNQALADHFRLTRTRSPCLSGQADQRPVIALARNPRNRLLLVPKRRSTAPSEPPG